MLYRTRIVKLHKAGSGYRMNGLSGRVGDEVEVKSGHADQPTAGGNITTAMWTASGSSTAKPSNRRSVIGRPRVASSLNNMLNRTGDTRHYREYRGRSARRSRYPRISGFPTTTQPAIATSIPCLYTSPPGGDEDHSTGGDLEAQPTTPNINRHHQSITS
jgi:hypothetical protein